MLLLLLMYFCSCDAIFTAKPEDRNYFLGETAVFECATNISGYTLTFSVTDKDNQAVSITETGDVASAITGSFILTQDNNGTTVRCFATPDMGSGNMFGQTTPAIIYSRDEINPVSNIETIQTDPCTITVRWKEPFLLPGLSVSYTVSVYYGGDIVSVQNVSTNTSTYHPTAGSGVYTILVVAFSGTLTSEATSATMDTDTRITATYNNRDTMISNDIWIYQFSLLDVCSLPPTNITATSCTVGSTSCHTTSDVTINDRIVTASYTDLPDDMIFNTSILIQYDVGGEQDVTLSTNNVTTSSHSLQNITVLNVTTGSLCVECYLVKGTDEFTVDAMLECNRLNVPDQTLPVKDIEVNQEVCYSDIPSNTWTLYGCDGGSISCNSTNAAVSITGINITGTPTDTPTPSASPTTTTISNVNTSTNILSSTNVAPTSKSSTIIAIAIIVPIIVVAILVVVIIAIALYKRNSRKAVLIKNHDVFYNRNRITSTGDDIAFDSRPPPNQPQPEVPHDQPNTNNPNYRIVFDSRPPPNQPQPEVPHDRNNTNNPNYEDVPPRPATTPSQPSPSQLSPSQPSQNKLLYADIGDIQHSINPVSQDEPSQYADIQGTVYSKCPESMRFKTIDHPPTQTELITVLVPRLSTKWMAIGIALNLNPDQLEEVHGNRPDDPDTCLKDILLMWEDSATDDKPYIWATMLDVLRSWKIREGGLADYLQQNFML